MSSFCSIARALGFVFIGLLCLGSSYSSTAFSNQQTILVLGDSLSSGHGFSPSLGWVNLLRQRLKQREYRYRVVNASISGDTSRNGYQRLPKLLKRYQPHIVIIGLGGNDALRGFRLQKLQYNLVSMINMAHASKAKVLLLAVRVPPNYGLAYQQELATVYAEVAKKYRVAFVPRVLADVALNKQRMQDDGIHPNASAQPQVLDNVWVALKPLLREPK